MVNQFGKSSRIYLNMIFLLFVILIPKNAFSWGAVGHRLIAEFGANLLSEEALSNCHISKDELISHTNDPDAIWRQQRVLHPHENKAHHFHIDQQPANWKTKKSSSNVDAGFLVYRIVEWIELAKKQREKKDWKALSQTLYGLSHYLGDLTQPMHLHHDHNGEEAGLPDIHSQYETKMVARYQDELRILITESFKQEKIPGYWSSLDSKTLIFNTAEESAHKLPKLYTLAKPALLTQPSNRKSKKSKGKHVMPRFVKPILWKNTKTMTASQISLGSKLIGKVFTEICTNHQF